MAQPQLAKKLLVAGASTAVFAIVAWLAYPHLVKEAPSVMGVDSSDALKKAMAERANEAAPDPVDVVPEPADGPAPVVRGPLDEETAANFFPAITRGKMWVYDPDVFTRRAANTGYRRKFKEHPDGGWQIRVNSLGMREDEDVLEEKPDVRILLTGDSHMDGLCANDETCANVLEALMREQQPDRSVEVLNGGVGSHNLYNYLGTWDRLAYLEPDMFIVVIYGGNDYSGAMLLHRYFNRRKPFKTKPHYIRTKELTESQKSLYPQELSQENYFQNNPDDEELAIELARAFCWELHQKCAEQGTEVMFVYLPPPTRGQPEIYKEALDASLAVGKLDAERLGVSDRITDGWIEFVRERGIPYLDLRDAIAATEEPLYWHADHHLNVAGHALVGRLLLETIEDLHSN